MRGYSMYRFWLTVSFSLDYIQSEDCSEELCRAEPPPAGSLFMNFMTNNVKIFIHKYYSFWLRFVVFLVFGFLVGTKHQPFLFNKLDYSHSINRLKWLRNIIDSPWLVFFFYTGWKIKVILDAMKKGVRNFPRKLSSKVWEIFTKFIVLEYTFLCDDDCSQDWYQVRWGGQIFTRSAIPIWSRGGNSWPM